MAVVGPGPRRLKADTMLLPRMLRALTPLLLAAGALVRPARAAAAEPSSLGCLSDCPSMPDIETLLAAGTACAALTEDGGSGCLADCGADAVAFFEALLSCGRERPTARDALATRRERPPPAPRL